jgi:hypothetical protein
VANDIKPPAFPGHGHTVRSTVAVDRHAINAIAEEHKPDSAAHLKPGHPAGAARPWPSVEKPTVRTDRSNGAHRPS